MSRVQTAVGRMRNTPGLGRDVALVLGLLLVGSLATVYIFAHYHVSTPWQSQYKFSAEFDQAPAVQLTSTQEVRIAGVQVGKIVSAVPADDGNAKLTFAIDNGHPVYRNATIVIRSKTPLNVMYVTLNPGTPSAGRLPAGGTLPLAQTQRVLQPYELLDHLDDRARAALTDLVDQSDVALAGAQQTLPAGLTRTDQAATSFKPVLTALAQRRANLRHLVTSVSQIATAAGANDTQLTQLADALQTTLGVVAANDAKLGSTLDALPGMTATLRSSMSSAAALTSQLSPTLRDLSAASGKLPDALTRLTSTVRRADALALQAGPVIAKARPVLDDLRPLAGNLDASVTDLSPVAANLPQATERLVPWLTNLGAFVYNTASSFSLGDANGGLGRADLVLKLYDPTGGGQ